MVTILTCVYFQVDVGSTKATNIGGVGDRMGRTTKNQRGASGGGSKAETPPTTSQQQRYETALYSREDIREQYCINKKETDVLDRSSHVRQRAKGFFGDFSDEAFSPAFPFSPHVLTSTGFFLDRNGS